MRKLFLLALLAVTTVSFAERVKLRQGVKVEIDGGSASVNFREMKYQWSLAGPKGSQAYVGPVADLDQDGYDLFAKIFAQSTSSSGLDPRSDATLTFFDFSGNPAATAKFYQCWPCRYQMGGTLDVQQGHAMSVELCSALPAALQGLDAARVYPVKVQWSGPFLTDDGIDTSNVVSVSPFTINVTDPALAALGVAPVTYSHVETDIKTKNTNITDVYVIANSGKLTHMTLTYTNVQGNTLTVDLGAVGVSSVEDDTLVNPGHYKVEYQVYGPVSWSFQ